MIPLDSFHMLLMKGGDYVYCRAITWPQELIQQAVPLHGSEL